MLDFGGGGEIQPYLYLDHIVLAVMQNVNA